MKKRRMIAILITILLVVSVVAVPVNAAATLTMRQKKLQAMDKLADDLGIPKSDSLRQRISELFFLEANGRYVDLYAYNNDIQGIINDAESSIGNTSTNKSAAKDGFSGGYSLDKGPVYYGSVNLYGGVLDIYDSDTSDMAVKLAKILYSYGHATKSITEQANIGWVVLNCLDVSGSSKIDDVIKFFEYNDKNPIVDDRSRSLLALARDVIFRWKLGKNYYYIGETGRTLPENYFWIYTEKGINYFKAECDAKAPNWDYSLRSPYDS